MKRITLARLAVLMLAVAGLVLQGCGGDDGGVSQSSYDQVVMERDEAVAAATAANAARDAAMEAQAAAEMAQMAAEAAQAEAEASQGRAEAARDEAQMQRDEAYRLQGMAETAQMVAEEAEAAAKMAQMEAETAQQAAEDMLASVETDRDMYMEAAATAEAARMAAVEAQTMAETARDAANTARDEAEAARMAAVEAQATAESERDAANTARDNYKTMAEQAQQAEADALNALAEARRQLAIAQGMVDAESAADIAARAGQLSMAIMGYIHPGEDVEGDTTGSDPDGALNDEADIMPGRIKSVTDAPMPRTGLAITHTEADGVKIARINNAPVEYQRYQVAGSMPPTVAGWDGVVLERRNDMDEASQTLYAYTDIATAATETFLEKYGSDLSGGMLTVDADMFGPAKSRSFPTRTEDNVQFSTEVAFAGTYDGVAGEFMCDDAATTACVVSANPSTGALTLSGGEFIFTPDDLSAVIAKGDGDYLYFGYWLHKPDAPGGMHRYSLLAGGNDMFVVRGDNPRTDAEDDISLVHFLAGQARYSGPAAGKYVTRDLVANTAQIGQFTANAELLADFATSVVSSEESGSEVPGNGMVNGVIKDFMEGGESLGNWRVTLMNASLGQIGFASGDTVASTDDDYLAGRTVSGHSMTHFTGSVEARIGASTAGGNWVGTFYGNDRSDGKPEAIAGMFEVSADHASIAGSFGVGNTAAE